MDGSARDKGWLEDRSQRDNMLGCNRGFATEARTSLLGRTMIGRALVPLLVVALLLCQGAFGPADRLLPSGPGPIAGHLNLVGASAEPGEAADSEGQDYHYYAVALLLITGALLWCRPASTYDDRATPVPSKARARVRLGLSAHGSSRGPTVFFLQVIRR